MEHHILFGDLSLKRLLVELDLREPENFSGKFRWLLDLRQATLTASADEVRMLGQFTKEFRRQNPVKEKYKMAAVAEDDVTYGLFRMFMVYAEDDSCELYISRSKPEALEWLDGDQTSESNIA